MTHLLGKKVIVKKDYYGDGRKLPLIGTLKEQYGKFYVIEERNKFQPVKNRAIEITREELGTAKPR